MIAAAAAAAVTAVFQFFADTVLFGGFFSGKVPKALLALLLKLLVYAGGFALLFLKFRDQAVGAAIGFGVGFFPAIMIYGIYTLKKGPGKVSDNKGPDGSDSVQPVSGGGE